MLKTPRSSAGASRLCWFFRASLEPGTLHNTLRRLNLAGERNGTRHITPEKISKPHSFRGILSK
jgi:hypothetical protein